MNIFHYTNIDSLALILKNRTIRFNRLDMVDDLEEGESESEGVKFSKYIFASCWTENSEESIPLWKMYGGDYGGVRIRLEHQMFKEYTVLGSMLSCGGRKVDGAIKTVIPPKDLSNPNFFIVPFLNYEDKSFYRKVEYVDNVNQFTKDAIAFNLKGNNQFDMSINTKSFGSFKHKRWRFQDEHRFVICILPENPMMHASDPCVSTAVMDSIMNNKPLPFTFYDLKLKDDALDNLEVTLSPSVTEAQKIIVQSLIEKYAPQAHVVESSLGKLVRLK